MIFPDLYNSNPIPQIMNFTINSTLNWMTSIVRNSFKSSTDIFILKILIYAFSHSNNMKLKIIAESIQLLLN